MAASRRTLPPNVFDPECPTRRALDLIADKWSTLIITLLATEPVRFGELRRRIGGISAKVLAERLRDLERNGIICRTVHPTVPPSVEYALTALGETLTAPLNTIAHWAESHVREIDNAIARYERSKAS
jgi:DNA-binding HxlR family transcriptional regulator